MITTDLVWECNTVGTGSFQLDLILLAVGSRDYV
jgi:hypothetical protein